MRGDLQVDKGNGVEWGFAREEPDPFSENRGMEGTFLGANAKNSEKMLLGHP